MATNDLTIGDVASLTGLTVKALRHYDDIGLLKPDHVDPRTGYRQYSGRQLRTAADIALLRSVDMPLADISVALSSPAQRQEQLAVHRDRLQAQRADLDHRLTRIAHLQETTMTDVQIRTFPETPIHHTTAPAGTDTAVSWPEMPSGGSLLTWGETTDDDAVTIHFAVEHPDQPNDSIAAFEAAVATTDDPETIPATFAAVLDWVLQNDRDIARPPLERLLPTDSDCATIELWVPLAPAGESGLGVADGTVEPRAVEVAIEAAEKE